MTTCLKCGKRLLSQASARCNWCGEIISDDDYQAHAQVEREAYFAHIAAHDAQSLANWEAMGGLNTPIDPLTRAPFLGPSQRAPLLGAPPYALPQDLVETRLAAQKQTPTMPAQPKVDADETTDTSDADTEERFRHLEI